jgi:hypothetical protein
VLDRVEIDLVRNPSATDPVTIELRDVVDEHPGEAVLASATLSPDSVPTASAAFVAFDFGSPASVTSGTRYAIAARTTGDSFYGWSCTVADVYAGGDAFTKSSDPPYDSWGRRAGYDLRFRSYVADDSDGDGVADELDNSPTVPNPDQADQDGDGTGDVSDADRDDDGMENGVDNCSDMPNRDQADGDGDGVGDVCDPDRDGDAVSNGADNCPDTSNGGQTDQDGDGMGDVCDADRDGDLVADESDNCPAAGNPDQPDADGDGAGDACDPDRDGDGVLNGSDNCPEAANGEQADWDGDGVGDACDADRPPAQQLTDLSEAVEGMGIHHGTKNSLVRKLQAALEAYNTGDNDNACSKLESFGHEVRAQSGKKIPAAKADQLIQAAEAIRQSLGC